MRRYLLAAVGAALAFAAIIAFATTAEASHRRHRHHATGAAMMVDVPARHVAAFRRAHVDRFIGPSGAWVGPDRSIYAPYHYWRGPLVILPPYKRHGYANAAHRAFACRATTHGRVCRERI
ncbi:MAG: hypothetical protein ACT4OU_13370 [Hyphomicrobium sp.]